MRAAVYESACTGRHELGPAARHYPRGRSTVLQRNPPVRMDHFQRCRRCWPIARKTAARLELLQSPVRVGMRLQSQASDFEIIPEPQPWEGVAFVDGSKLAGEAEQVKA